MRSLVTLLSAAALALLGAVAANAHHSFAAQFDRTQQVTFTGTVTKVEWTNPHSRFYVTGPDPDMDDETPVDWNIEMVSANVLMRQGWRHDTLQVGDVVTVEATRARKDPHVVNSSSVVRDSGEELFRRRPDQVNQ
jgi:ABC-type glycerol-3-phosphate transport system substrate-binding protein